MFTLVFSKDFEFIESGMRATEPFSEFKYFGKDFVYKRYVKAQVN